MFENFDIWYDRLGDDDDHPFMVTCRDQEVENDERWVTVSFTVEEAKKFASIFRNKFVFTKKKPNMVRKSPNVDSSFFAT